MKIRNRAPSEKQEVNMTAMIDIVFLLLVFFMVTLKIVEQEGDFSVRMPLASNSSGAVDDTELPLKLRLKADPNGHLTSIAMNDVQLGTDFEALRDTVIGLLGGAQPGEGAEGARVIRQDAGGERHTVGLRTFHRRAGCGGRDPSPAAVCTSDRGRRGNCASSD